MNLENLHTLIRESIAEYVKEIDDAAEIAANEARISKCEEAILARENKLAAIAESDHSDLIDGNKVKALENEIKELKKAKAKFEKAAEKKAAKKAKKSAPKDEKEVTTDAPIDETDVMAEMNLEEENTEEALNESFLKMQKLAGVITETQYREKKSLVENQLNEDILELKQMSKQLYSFLKSKGYVPKLVTKIDYKEKSKVGEDSPQMAVIQVNDEQGMVNVAVSPWSAAHSIIGNKPDWYHEAVKKFGNSERWDSNSEILNHINKLGEELAQQIKSKYPNMLYRFRRDGENWWYIMDFGYGQTKKGGQFNPNDPKNKLA